MKNLNKLAMGILVGALAIGFSAFTNANSENDTVLNVYHYTGVEAGTGKIQFASGEPTLGACNGSNLPCRWETNSSLTSPLSRADIESQSTVTARRP